MKILLIAFGALMFIIARLILLIYSESKKFKSNDKKENTI